MVRLTDLRNMTIVVDWDGKPQNFLLHLEEEKKKKKESSQFPYERGVDLYLFLTVGRYESCETEFQ